jgi:hypothetical protein
VSAPKVPLTRIASHDAIQRAPLPFAIRITRRGYEAGIASHRKRGAVERDDAVGRQLLQPRRGRDDRFRSKAVPLADRREVGGKIAHDALDDFGAQPVVIGQRVTPGCREPAGGDRLGIAFDLNLVLHKALRQLADGAGAEAEQQVAGVGGVALEIPPQSPLALRDRQFILGQREMVEPDPLISGRLQRLLDRGRLLVALEAVGQPGLVDPALILLERGNMRVAEHGEAAGPQLDAAIDGIETGGDRLVRQSVDQIEIDAGNAGLPQAARRRRGLFKALHAVDRVLDRWIEALHPKACPVDAAQRERIDHRPRQRARVDLDGDLRRRKHEERMPDSSDQVGE